MSNLSQNKTITYLKVPDIKNNKKKTKMNGNKMKSTKKNKPPIIKSPPSTFTYSKDITSLEYLCDILSFKRPHNSYSETVFIDKYIASVPGIEKDPVDQNYYIHIPNEDGSKCDRGFSAHTDTVHYVEGYQEIYIMDDEENTELTNEGFICNNGKDVLGADDGTGIWLMLNMIHNKIPGTYFFFRGEEVGGIGSTAIYDNFEHLYKHLNCLISFDRKGTSDIITHQMGQRCCSEAFSDSLAKELNTHFPEAKYISDPTGSFTDSANFIEGISECTNLSVGYYSQHTKNEIQMVLHPLKLRDALLKMNWDSLVYERDPNDIDFEYNTNDYNTYDYYGTEYNNYLYLTYYEIKDIVKKTPELAVEIMDTIGITQRDVVKAQQAAEYYKNRKWK